MPTDLPRDSRLHKTAWILVCTLLLARLLPSAAQPGMFFDGVTYATIARNMAVGNGDVWHPAIFGPGCDYHEAPTLAFWLESMLFRAFGDHFWVEKLYSALMGLGTAALVAATWRLLFRHRPALRDCSWLPVTIWLLVPAWGWMYDSNMLENTLGLFALASVYASLRAAYSSRRWLAWIAVAAVCLVGAVQSKGPVGLFPLVTPLVIGLTLRRDQLRHMIVVQEGLALLFLFFFALLLAQQGAHEFLTTYFHQQVVASLEGHRELVHSRLGRLMIVAQMIGQLILPLAAAASVVLWSRRTTVSAAAHAADDDSNGGQSPNAAFWFCLLTALSASLPIAISPKQSGHYAFPSYALYALAIAIWCAPAVLELFGSTVAGAANVRAHRLLRGLAITGTGCVLIATCFMAGRPHRDKDVYHDTLAVGRVVPPQAVIGETADLNEDFPIRLYLARWDNIEADRTVGGGPANLLKAGSAAPQFCITSLEAPPPTGYKQVAAGLVRYRLYERSKSSSTVSAWGRRQPDIDDAGATAPQFASAERPTSRDTGRLPPVAQYIRLQMLSKQRAIRFGELERAKLIAIDPAEWRRWNRVGSRIGDRAAKKVQRQSAVRVVVLDDLIQRPDINRDPGFFPAFAGRGIGRSFAGMNFPAGKFRETRKRPPRWPQANEKLAIPLDNDHGNLLLRFGAGGQPLYILCVNAARHELCSKSFYQHAACATGKRSLPVLNDHSAPALADCACQWHTSLRGEKLLCAFGDRIEQATW